VILRFEITLQGGVLLMRGEGRVVGFKPKAFGDAPGLAVRFTRLDTKSKALADRAHALREQRGFSRSGERPSAAPPSTPTSERLSGPPAPSGASVTAGPPPLPPSARGRTKPPPLPSTHATQPGFARTGLSSAASGTPAPATVGGKSAPGSTRNRAASVATAEALPATETPGSASPLSASGMRATPPPAHSAPPSGAEIAAAMGVGTVDPETTYVDEGAPERVEVAHVATQAVIAPPLRRDELLARLRDRARGLDPAKVEAIAPDRRKA